MKFHSLPHDGPGTHMVNARKENSSLLFIYNNFCTTLLSLNKKHKPLGINVIINIIFIGADPSKDLQKRRAGSVG